MLTASLEGELRPCLISYGFLVYGLGEKNELSTEPSLVQVPVVQLDEIVPFAICKGNLIKSRCLGV